MLERGGEDQELENQPPSEVSQTTFLLQEVHMVVTFAVWNHFQTYVVYPYLGAQTDLEVITTKALAKEEWLWMEGSQQDSILKTERVSELVADTMETTTTAGLVIKELLCYLFANLFSSYK